MLLQDFRPIYYKRKHCHENLNSLYTTDQNLQAGMAFENVYSWIIWIYAI